MATDFRFNGTNSYSPLLAALAQAPYHAATLKIEQEKNNRERLSSLLTNMSNAAQLARTVQQQQAINEQKKLMAQKSPLAGAAAGVAPEAAAAGTLGVTAPFMGLDAMMGQQPSAPTSQLNLSGEGGTPMDSRKAVIMNKLFPSQYEVSTNPTTGMRELVSKIPGLPSLPVDQSGTPMATGDIKPGESLNPTQKKEAVDTGGWLTDQVKELKNNDVYKNAQITIDGARRMRALTAANIPLSEINIQAAQTKLAGINRLTEVELERSGIDPGLLPKWQQMVSKMQSKGFIQKNRDELNQMADALEKVQQDNLNDLGSSTLQTMQALRPDIPAKRHQAVINGAIGQYLKPIKSKNKSDQSDAIDMGAGFSYTVNR
jgi:hypothetical protein